MHTMGRIGTLTAAGMVLALGALTACSPDDRADRSEEAAASSSPATASAAASSDMVADVRWSEYITREEFEQRWKVDPDEAVYDASRTRYTTAEEFREAHDGESHEDWYPRVAKKDYDAYMREKTEEIGGPADEG